MRRSALKKEQLLGFSLSIETKFRNAGSRIWMNGRRRGGGWLHAIYCSWHSNMSPEPQTLTHVHLYAGMHVDINPLDAAEHWSNPGFSGPWTVMRKELNQSQLWASEKTSSAAFKPASPTPGPRRRKNTIQTKDKTLHSIDFFLNILETKLDLTKY